MLQKIHQALSEYSSLINQADKRFNSWETFCTQNKHALNTIADQTNGFLSFFEANDKKSFGVTLKIIPASDFVTIDDIRMCADKLAPMLIIRQDHQGLAIFEFVSSYFKDGDGYKEVKHLREPIWPQNFDYQEMIPIVAKFIRYHIEWEQSHQTQSISDDDMLNQK